MIDGNIFDNLFIVVDAVDADSVFQPPSHTGYHSEHAQSTVPVDYNYSDGSYPNPHQHHHHHQHQHHVDHIRHPYDHQHQHPQHHHQHHHNPQPWSAHQPQPTHDSGNELPRQPYEYYHGHSYGHESVSLPSYISFLALGAGVVWFWWTPLGFWGGQHHLPQNLVVVTGTRLVELVHVGQGRLHTFLQPFHILRC